MYRYLLLKIFLTIPAITGNATIYIFLAARLIKTD